MTDSTDDIMIDTPDGPMTFAAWKKTHPVQVPSRRTKGKDLPTRVKRFTDKDWPRRDRAHLSDDAGRPSLRPPRDRRTPCPPSRRPRRNRPARGPIPG